MTKKTLNVNSSQLKARKIRNPVQSLREREEMVRDTTEHNTTEASREPERQWYEVEEVDGPDEEYVLDLKDIRAKEQENIVKMEENLEECNILLACRPLQRYIAERDWCEMELERMKKGIINPYRYPNPRQTRLPF